MTNLFNSPFKHLVMTIGELPTTFVESMSYYEALCWLVGWIEKELLPKVNENAAAVKELQDELVALKAYVDEYFTNLNVQTEINNKLDAMAQDGTLAEIINEQIFGELNDSLNETKADVSEIKGEDIKYHFIKNGDALGDCTLVQVADENILIDLSASTTEAPLISYLGEIGVTHIDKIIISHFHYDHIGGSNAEGLAALCSAGLVDSETIAYVPTAPNWNLFINDVASEVSNVVGRVTSMITAFETVCANYDVTIERMSTGDELTLGEAKIVFYNCSADEYLNYYSITLEYDDDGTIRYYTDYNNFSMLALVKNTKRSALFTGDMSEKSEEINTPVITDKIDILKIPHHAVNHTAFPPFMYKVIGDINVYMNPDGLTNPRRPYIASPLVLGKRVYGTDYSGGTIVIEDKFGEIIDNNTQHEFSKLISAAVGFNYLGLNGVDNFGQVEYYHVTDHMSSTDLDDFKDAGVYISPTASSTSELSNVPSMFSNSAFRLEVIYGASEERIVQRIHALSIYDENYSRYFNGTTWSTWIKDSGEYANFALTTGSYNSDASITMSKSAGSGTITLDGTTGIKVGISGSYKFSGQLTLTSLTDGVLADVQLIKNGTRIQRAYVSGTGENVTINIPSFIAGLANNDVITIKVVTSDSSSVTVNANSNIVIEKMS